MAAIVSHETNLDRSHGVATMSQAALLPDRLLAELSELTGPSGEPHD